MARTILLVEPVDDHADLVTKTLEHELGDVRVVRTTSLTEVSAHLKGERVHLIIAYLGANGKDAAAALRRLREEAFSGPVIVTVDRASERFRRLAMRKGAAWCLSKGPEFFVALPYAVRAALREWDVRAQLDEWQTRYEQLLDKASVGICSLDRRGRITKANRAARLLVGLEEDQVVGKSFETFLSENSRRAIYARTAGTRSREIHLDGERVEVINAAGDLIPVEVRAWPHLRDGRVVGFQVVLRELATEEAALERERRLAAQLRETVRKLEYKTAELEESQRLQSQFISNVSHEFRTPLNGILGYAELLRDGFYGELTDEQKEVLRNIISCGQHLLELVNEILDLAKIQSHQLKLLLEPCTPRDVIDPVISTVRPLIKEKGLELRLGPREDRPLILCDLKRVYQVLLNLASNAVKFTERGFVEIGALEKGDFVEFYVRDTGSGIPEDKREQIFHHFVQLDGSIARKHGGLGIGLSLSKELVELHGGEIGVESKTGVGSRFYFTIPVYGGEQGQEAEPPATREESLARQAKPVGPDRA